MSVSTAADGIKAASTPLSDADVASLEVVADEDLGTQAIRGPAMEGVPAIVLDDCHGGQKPYAREGA